MAEHISHYFVNVGLYLMTAGGMICHRGTIVMIFPNPSLKRVQVNVDAVLTRVVQLVSLHDTDNAGRCSSLYVICEGMDNCETLCRSG